MAEKYKVKDRAKQLGIARKTYYRYKKMGMPEDMPMAVQQAWIADFKGKLETGTANRTPQLPLEDGSQQAPDAPHVPLEERRLISWKEMVDKQRALQLQQKTDEGRQKIIEEERDGITREAKAMLRSLQLTVREDLCEECRQKIENCIHQALLLAGQETSETVSEDLA